MAKTTTAGARFLARHDFTDHTAADASRIHRSKPRKLGSVGIIRFYRSV